MNCVVTISAPNDVIWKHELCFLISDRERFELAPPSTCRVHSVQNEADHEVAEHDRRALNRASSSLAARRSTRI
ncbi:unnamed protein product [Onchocerca ochengi]|uniref:Uncharacterized protein n=1 Tax=Onchocerca ochengi TaxID=42157 RepID=A0A182DWW3_ONCOC|nr:unnamed protein product [Onchocerca ochengi]